MRFSTLIIRGLTLLLCFYFVLGAATCEQKSKEVSLDDSGTDIKPSPKPELPSSSFNCEPSGDDLKCLVCNCFHEARGESAMGQLAVHRTVFSRKNHPEYPASVCGVVYQKSQFSWTLSSSKRRQVIGPDKAEAAGFNKCLQSAQASLKHRNDWYASHYHTTNIRPRWASTCRGRKQIGSHFVYTGGCGGVRPINGPADSSGATGVAMMCFKRLGEI